eukprot:CAMPEP_0171208498 /NCGR_PEP_ID=MMETSP0790-20130122/28119_1 /TAXON_ID=2925 /ORGANISM="Alexandrium catenella, Strain OF101" /LENGTH=347 /DNA_ID=CAMNT_0011674095 /DNA_START=80 /DNA_END=1123 /DNA_ORIENTATION=+
MRQRPTKSDKKRAAAAEAAGPGDDEKARYQKVIEAIAPKAPPSLQPYIVKAAPVLAQAIVLIQIALPYIMKGIAVVTEFIAGLPEKILYACLGFLICFFGGVFPATIAAYEAWSLCGGNEAVASVKDIYREICKVQEASKEDDEKDDDNDGVKDVDQISGGALAKRKVSLVLGVIDAHTVNSAMAQLWTGWIGVLAVLKIKFAKTVTLGEVIGEKLYEPAKSYAEPAILAMVGEEHKQWVPIGLKWCCKAIAITLAWWVQRVVSAFHSAIRGGLMCGKYVVNFAHEKGYLKENDENSYMDEAIGWGIAAAGLLFQFMTGFVAPFPLNILLLPITIVEWIIVWSVNAQ